MPPEELVRCLKELNDRLALHQKALQQSEIQTRYSLVDPLLRALGWKVEDPRLVLLHDQELCAGNERFCSYDLLHDGEVCLALKTKALNSDLTQVRAQRDDLRNEERVPYLAVTDGRSWEVYATHKLVVSENDLVLKFDILIDPDESAQQVILLQPSVIGTYGPVMPVWPLSEASNVSDIAEDSAGADATRINEL